MTETDRRLQEASRLGTALVQQRKELSARLIEVEQQQGEQEIRPELRQKLIEVEKEYNEIGRDSARAFLAPKSRVQSSEDGSNGHVTMEARVGRLWTFDYQRMLIGCRGLPVHPNLQVRLQIRPRN